MVGMCYQGGWRISIKYSRIGTTPHSTKVMAHRTGRCLETNEAFKAVKAGSVMPPPFLFCPEKPGPLGQDSLLRIVEYIQLKI